MTREDTQKLLATIEAIFPNFKVNEPTITVNAWHFVLEEYDKEEVNMALKTYIRTSGSAFPPSPAQLSEMIYKPQQMTTMGEGDAWAMVRKAIGKGIYHAVEEFEKMPKEVQEAVGSPLQIQTWAMSEDFNESVIYSNFRSAYKQAIARKETMERMPIEARLRMEQLQKKALGGFVDGREIERIEG